ncbi:MAG: hypothetical protein LC778_05165 [Acidobacteria bacterium]|nr:hypothetical protein [Acidobacteriota bacterium]
MADIDDKTITAIDELFKRIIETFGVRGTIYIAITVFFVLLARRLYNDWQENRKENIALAEKERTIQRLAAENREWHVMFLKAQGMTDKQIERIVLKNIPNNPAEARTLLQDDASNPKSWFPRLRNKSGDREKGKIKK